MSITRCFLSIYALSLSAFTHAAELRLLNWDEYIAPEVIERFTASTGHRIQVIPYDSDAKRDEILASPAAKQFDLVVIDNYSTRQFESSGLLTNLSTSPNPHQRHIKPRWQDSCGPYGSPYFWGTLGIAYRADKVATAPQSWSALLHPSPNQTGHVGMILDAIDTLVPALKFLGLSMNSESERDLKAAFGLLNEQRAAVLTYQHPFTFLETERADQLHMTLAFSGDVYAMNDDEDGPWRYVIPQEGTALWVDCIAVVAHSPHQQAAIDFVHFLHDPKIAALNAREVGSATTNDAALVLLDESMRNDPMLYPTGSVLDDSEPYRTLSPATLMIRERIIEALSHHEAQ